MRCKLPGRPITLNLPEGSEVFCTDDRKGRIIPKTLVVEGSLPLEIEHAYIKDSWRENLVGKTIKCFPWVPDKTSFYIAGDENYGLKAHVAVTRNNFFENAVAMPIVMAFFSIVATAVISLIINI